MMAKITPEDVSSRSSRLSARDQEDLQSYSNFLDDGDTEMAAHIFSGFGKGLKILVQGLFALKSTREKKEKK